MYTMFINIDMNKFYTIRDDLKLWDVNQINIELEKAINAADVNFKHWKGTVELKNHSGAWAPKTLHYDTNALNSIRTVNGDVNITTNLEEYTELPARLFSGSGKRGRVVDGVMVSSPRMTDDKLSELNPFFKGTIIEELHEFMKAKFQAPIRIRCQNRTVNGTAQGLYWHKDNPVENRFHIPLWTNPGHLLLFTDVNFKWDKGFDKEEAMKPMDVVGHYIPPDGRIYEIFTKDYMHAVASVGVGWYQAREEQTRCHLSFWVGKN